MDNGKLRSINLAILSIADGGLNSEEVNINKRARLISAGFKYRKMPWLKIIERTAVKMTIEKIIRFCPWLTFVDFSFSNKKRNEKIATIKTPTYLTLKFFKLKYMAIG